MLASLHITNIVLIQSLSLDMSRGMTALTGETGAGKSILLDALGLALGDRADSGLLRKGADQGSVTATFDLSPTHKVFHALAEQGIECDGELIIRRTLGADGRSKAFLNDKPISVSLLKDIGDMLVDIHGQFETHGLLNSKKHCGLLDNFGGLDHDVDQVRHAYAQWREAEKALTDHRAKLAKAKKDEDYLTACIQELQTISPQKGEEEELLQKRQRLQHYEAIMQGLNEAHQSLEGDKATNESLYKAVRSLEKIADKAEDKIDPIIVQLDQHLSALRDIAGDIEMMAHEWGENENIEHVDDRIHELRAMARKHNVMCDDLPQLLSDMQDQIATIHSDDQRLQTLEKALTDTQNKYMEEATLLTSKRQQAGARLSKSVMVELPDLRLGNAVFRVGVEGTDTPAAKGMDDVCFLIQTNPGSPEGELGKVASGGELSRIMLALKVVLSQTSPVPTMIFDEVDSGIGGATADAVGQRLSRMAKDAQMLVVTHSPQIAAVADHHWIISKADDDAGMTQTSVNAITDETLRIDEIARMVSGASLTDEARAAAKALREAA